MNTNTVAKQKSQNSQLSLLVQAVGRCEDGSVRVEFRQGDLPWKGVVNVIVPEGAEDTNAIAELCALRHLMQDRMMFGCTFAPRGTRICVTAGVIRKLLRMDSQKGHLVRYARFLFYTFDGCEMEVVKSSDLADLLPRMLPVDNSETEFYPAPEITITAEASQLTAAPFAVLGEQVGITRHAIERYQERYGTPYVRNAIARITKILASNEVREMTVSERSKFRAMQKHGTEGRAYLYPPSQTVFVVVPEEDMPVIATIYKLEPEAKQAVYVGGRIEMRRR